MIKRLFNKGLAKDIIAEQERFEADRSEFYLNQSKETEVNENSRVRISLEKELFDEFELDELDLQEPKVVNESQKEIQMNLEEID